MKNKTISSQTPKGNERRCNELVGPGEGTKRVAGSLKNKKEGSEEETWRLLNDPSLEGQTAQYNLR